MGLCLSSSSSDQGNGKIRGTLKIVLLGTAGTGKSTFHKQMKIIFSPDSSLESAESSRLLFGANLLMGLRDLSSLIEDKEIKISSKSKAADKILRKIDNVYGISLDDPILINARTFWEDSAVQKVLNDPRNGNFSEYAVALNYIMKEWNRMTAEDWTPTAEDLLQLRARTSGFLETNVQVKDYNWQLIDVGGQRIERRKWPSITADLNAILFWASLNDYDADAESPSFKTRAHESISVWKEILSSEPASTVPVILFLNKKDLFEKRVHEVPIEDTWPDFDSKLDTSSLYNAGVKFFMMKYLQCLDEPDCRILPESVYVHVTCALDTDQMRVVSSSIRDFVVQQRLRRIGAL